VRTERGLVRHAAQLVAFAEGQRTAELGAREIPHPVSWPAVKPGEAKKEWNDLRRWVDQLRIRFPNAIRLPDCWWQHNDLVEVLAALRDCERACFAATAPASAAVEWQRALRDMELRMEIWIRRFTCSVPGRGHETTEPHDVAPPPGWDDFVQRDLDQRRRQRGIGADLAEN
jgi:hypothetical protein